MGTWWKGTIVLSYYGDIFLFLFKMVWEQGSVVIVMLSKLTENGEAMCHRYWPEEGSDLYHIYEVTTHSNNLVSNKYTDVTEHERLST